MSESPLRQQIAEAIHGVEWGPCRADADGYTGDCEPSEHLDQADAVVALLNLTEERQQVVGRSTTGRPGLMVQRGKFRIRLVTPWLPSTPPDTSDVTQNADPNEKV